MLAFAGFTNKLRDGSLINPATLALMDGNYDNSAGAEPLTAEQIEALANSLSCGGVPEQLILLMDEIQRNRHRPEAISTLTWIVIESAGRNSAHHDSVGQRIQKGIRSASALTKLIGHAKSEA